MIIFFAIYLKFEFISSNFKYFIFKEKENKKKRNKRNIKSVISISKKKKKKIIISTLLLLSVFKFIYFFLQNNKKNDSISKYNYNNDISLSVFLFFFCLRSYIDKCEVREKLKCPVINGMK